MVTFLQYAAILASATEPAIELSLSVANRKTMVGGKIKVLPNTTNSETLMTTEYSFKKIDLFVKKQNSPAAKNRIEETSGRTRENISAFAVVPFVRLEPVALKKKANASTITHNESTLTGSFRITSAVKTKTGYKAAIT